MARKTTRQALTQRQKQCREASRAKARRLFVHSWAMRAVYVLLAMASLSIISAGVWEWRTQGVSRFVSNTMNAGYKFTARAGFTVDDIVLQGRQRTAKADVQQALEAVRGQPIFRVSLNDLRENLEKIPAVKSAHVERALPHTLIVRLSERVPVAVWQHSGALMLIDDEGAAMHDLALKDHQGLPLVVGQGAAAKVQEALALLESEPELKSMVSAMIRVGDRRWNIRLHGGMEVRLPEENAAAAWAQLAQLQREQNLLHRAVQTVDLRIPSRMILRMTPAEKRPFATPGARET